MAFSAMKILKQVVSATKMTEDVICPLEIASDVVNLNIDYLLEDLRMVSSLYIYTSKQI